MEERLRQSPRQRRRWLRRLVQLASNFPFIVILPICGISCFGKHQEEPFKNSFLSPSHKWNLTSTNNERNDLCTQELQVIHEIIQVHADSILKLKYRSRIVDTKTILNSL